MKLKTAQQIIDGWHAHVARKHKGLREVTGQQTMEAQEAYLNKHLDAYYRQGLEDGISIANAEMLYRPRTKQCYKLITPTH
jgi:hypothetical protein